MKKRGQMQLSFGMIFSIILIIAFVAFAFYAIKGLLDAQNKTKIAVFADDLQAGVDKVWKGSGASQKFSVELPKKIDEICFVDREALGENLMLVPNDFNFPLIKIDHLDLEKTFEEDSIIRGGEKMLCIPNDGKVEMTLTKSFGEDLVTVRK